MNPKVNSISFFHSSFNLLMDEMNKWKCNWIERLFKFNWNESLKLETFCILEWAG